MCKTLLTTILLGIGCGLVLAAATGPDGAEIDPDTALIRADGGEGPAADSQAGPATRMETARIQALIQERDYLQQRVEELEDELDGHRTEDAERINDLTNENQSLRETLRKAQADLDSAVYTQSSLRDLEGQVESLKSQLRRAADQLKARTDQLAEEVKLQDAYREAQEQIVSQQFTIRKFELALKGVARESEVRVEHDEERSLLETKCRLLRQEADDAAAALREAEARFHRMTLDHEQLEDEVEALSAARISDHARAAGAEREVLELRTELDQRRLEQETVAGLRRKIAELKEENAALQSAFEQATRRDDSSDGNRDTDPPAPVAPREP